MEVVVPTQIEVVGLEVVGRPGFEGSALRLEKSDVELLDHLLGDIGLDVEDVSQNGVVALRPKVRVLGHADELQCHADLTGPTR